MRMRVQSLASNSGLRILHCHELWCRSQTWLGSHIAVEASGYSSSLTPTPPICGPKKKKGKKKKKKSVCERIKGLFSSVDSKPSPKPPSVYLSTWRLSIFLKGWLMDENSVKLAPESCQKPDLQWSGERFHRWLPTSWSIVFSHRIFFDGAIKLRKSIEVVLL